MKLNVVERPPIKVACLRCQGPYGSSITTFWQTVVEPWIREAGLENQPRYGIGLDNPFSTPAEECRYDACVEVPSDFVATGDAFVKIIPGGRYAVFGFKGKVEHIGAALESILNDWFPREALQLDSRPAFTYFPEKVDYNQCMDALQCEIFVPVIYMPSHD